MEEDLNLDSIMQNMIEQLNKKIENLLIDGLKLKGFEFDKRVDLENFIKKNCRCEDHTDIGQKIYYIRDDPFMLHNYRIDFDYKKMTANYGTFKFL